MHIDMPEQLRKFLQHEVEIGLYSNESEVVRDAVRRMKEEKYNHSLNELRAELAIGMKQIEEGKVHVYDKNLSAQIIKNAMIKHKNNIPVKASVKPQE